MINKIVTFIPGKISKGGQNTDNMSDKRPKPPFGSDGKQQREQNERRIRIRT